ncbi:DUF58 domain-containing protein [Clostridium senegalense]|uniref:DUF58 domain-containing protein n=1 Tax=Clostridium senegalense TaxID=1465809 RepID=A0A6M0H159_9CLOT|nr:DUF58 domain-containing protein [Clostridium senegalense]NEU04516.1 DUF58 domain-containing protein [Clostridium senegalense]
MISLYVFMFLFATVCVYLAYITRQNGFENLNIFRKVQKNKIIEDEKFNISIIIENNKKLPIAFLNIAENIPEGINYYGENLNFKEGQVLWHNSSYSIGSYKRKVRTYTLCGKRGTYLIKNMKVTIGDFFGLNTSVKEIEDYIEILIYPRINPLGDYNFDITNFNGNDTVRRWIQKDPLYIKGIREYNVEDRMKDIHWKSSLKMSKLMVKDYDFTSERELVIIFNVQCAEKAWQNIQKSVIEEGIRLLGAFSNKALKEGIPTGAWTNAQLLSYVENYPSQIKPELNSFGKIMEMCARIDYSAKKKFVDYLKQNIKNFYNNCTYVIITPYLDEESCKILSDIVKKNVNIKIIDISQSASVLNIPGIERLSFKGGRV